MQHTRRAFVGAIGGVALAGCTGERDPGVEDEVDGGSNQGESESGDDADAPDPEVGSVSLLLNWRISGLHAPYFAALSNGFYEEEGFDEVEIESGQGSDFAAQQVAIGNTEFAISSSDQVLNVGSRELSPRCVGVVMQRNPVVLFSPAGRFDGFEPEALDGVTVGSGPGMVRQMAEAYLEHHGVLEDVEYVDSGFDTVQQLLTGEIDVAGGVFSDVVDAEHQGEEIERLEVGEVIPSYGHQVAVEAGFAEENPETVRSFLRATARGAVEADRDPEAAVDALVDRQPELEEVRENQRDKWDLMHEEYMSSPAVEENGWGWSEPEPWKRTHETLEAGGFFEGEVDPDTVWTNALLDAEYEYIADYADLTGE
jgi:NitT/TauT family transport system substrate-binding protein